MLLLYHGTYFSTVHTFTKKVKSFLQIATLSHTLLQKKFKYLYSTPFNLWQFSRIFLQIAFFCIFIFSLEKPFCLNSCFLRNRYLFLRTNYEWINVEYLFLCLFKTITRLKMLNHVAIRITVKFIKLKQDIFFNQMINLTI